VRVLCAFVKTHEDRLLKKETTNVFNYNWKLFKKKLFSLSNFASCGYIPLASDYNLIINNLNNITRNEWNIFSIERK